MASEVVLLVQALVPQGVRREWTPKSCPLSTVTHTPPHTHTHERTDAKRCQVSNASSSSGDALWFFLSSERSEVKVVFIANTKTFFLKY